MTPAPICLKPFTLVNYKCSSLARVLAFGKPFQLSLIFAGKAEAYPTLTKRGAPLLERLLAQITNIRLGRKGLTGTNTHAYYRNS